jgi:hypothetical protein
MVRQAGYIFTRLDDPDHPRVFRRADRSSLGRSCHTTSVIKTTARNDLISQRPPANLAWTHTMKKLILIAMLAAVAVQPLSLYADDGMWTFDNPPRKQWKERYNFEPSELTEHLRLASVG